MKTKSHSAGYAKRISELVDKYELKYGIHSSASRDREREFRVGTEPEEQMKLF